MIEPVTYIGFFQEGEKSGSSFVNFVPVYEVSGDRNFWTFPCSFFYNGRLQLKQPNTEYNNLQNIGLREINGAKENVLQKVTFDKKHFERTRIGEGGVPTSDEGKFINRIEVPKEKLVEDVIQVEELSLSNIHKGDNVYVVLEPEDLASSNDPDSFGYLEEYKERPERSLFDFGKIEESPYVFHSKSLYAKVQLEDYVNTKALLRLSKETDVYSNGDMEVLDAIPVHIEQAKWNSGGQISKTLVDRSISLVRLKESAVPCQGRLKWNGEGYDVERTGKPIPVATPVVESAPVVEEPPAEAVVEEITPAAEPLVVSSGIVKQIHQYLIDSGRDVSVADVINYCICITQGFITTFAGAPGTGKTSLCRLLAKAMGLQEREELEDDTARANYTEVSVERGWTSLKDFIGYPNPFPKEDKDKNKKQASKGKVATDLTEEDDDIIPSNVDVYDAFKRMDGESRDKDKDCGKLPPDLMLLDEANLSPIEYYWSQFLRNCQLDDEAEMKKRKIQVSRKKSWLLSPNLRFLATVNFDHTTEELSPRFLDRTWVVTLETPETSENIGKSIHPSLPESITMDTLKENFGFQREGEKFPEETKSVWEKICGAFREESVNLPLSPRNTNAVKNFCIAAARFKGITAVQALDLAVLQKILPTISGYGDRYESLTGKLIEIAGTHGLDKTEKKLQAMRAEAKQNSNFYQFFIR